MASRPSRACRCCGNTRPSYTKTWNSLKDLPGARGISFVRLDSDRVCPTCTSRIRKGKPQGTAVVPMESDSSDGAELPHKKPAAPECSTLDLTHEISDEERKVRNPLPKSPQVTFYKVYVPPERLERIRNLQQDVQGCRTQCTSCLKRVPVFHTLQRGKLYMACTFCIRYCMAEMGWDNQGNYDAALEKRHGLPEPAPANARGSKARDAIAWKLQEAPAPPTSAEVSASLARCTEVTSRLYENIAADQEKMCATILDRLSMTLT